MNNKTKSKSKLIQNGRNSNGRLRKNENSNSKTSLSSIPAAYLDKPSRRKTEIRSNKDSTTICGSEFIDTINGSVSFDSTKYQVNPGLPIFTWLSERASGFEKYFWRKLVFEYVPAEAVTTTAGSIYMVADYDPEDSKPSSLSALATYETQNESRVFQKFSLDVSSKRMFDGVQRKKVRRGPVGGDLQLYDGCSLSVGTISCSGSSAIGQLWCHYEIDLISPQTDPTSGIVPAKFSLYNTSVAITGFVSGINKNIAFDEPIIDGLELFDGLDGDGNFTLPCGCYLIQCNLSYFDAATEVISVSWQLHKDALPLVPPIQMGNKTSVGGSFIPGTLTAFFESDGTNTLAVIMGATFTTGPVSAPADGNRIAFLAL